MPLLTRSSSTISIIVALIGSLLLALFSPMCLAQSESEAARSKAPVRISRGLLQEGAFLANQSGRLLSLEQGGAAFVFDKNNAGQAVPAMSMLPCATLMRMEQIRDARSGDVRFAVSGQVFLKAGRNYLLPTFYKVKASKNEPQSQTPEPMERDPAVDADPTVDALISSLDTLTPATSNTSGGGAPLALPSGNLLPEGSFLKSRLGRIIRTNSGALALSVNNDADTAAGPTVPLTILPSRAMTLIERLLDEHGSSSVFKISGRIYLYRGQNFLMPAMVQLQLDTTSGLSSAQ